MSLFEDNDIMDVPVEPTPGAAAESSGERPNEDIQGFKPTAKRNSPFFLSERYHKDIKRAATPSSSDEGKPGTDRYNYYQLRKEFPAGLADTADADRDNSGDYDPSQERASQRAAGRKRRPAQASAARANRWKRAKKGPVPETPSEDVQPRPTEAADNTLGGKAAAPGPTAPPTRSSRLRPRNGQSRPAQPSTAESTVSDHAVIVDCKQCFNSGIPCKPSSPNAWPCEGCRDIGVACELRNGSQKKQQCEACRLLKLRCEFQDGKEHPGDCHQCGLRGAQCVAAPRLDLPKSLQRLNEATKERPAEEIDQDTTSCYECKTAKARCSLKEKNGFHKCDRCQKQGLPCNSSSFAPVRPSGTGATSKPPTPAAKATPSKNASATLKGAESSTTSQQLKSTESVRQDVADDSKGQARIEIRTRLAHPVKIGGDCRWCHDIIYGLVGIGERTVTVVNLPKMGGFKEVGGDPPPPGAKSSLMCNGCLVLRCEILGCDEHQFTQIADPDSCDFDDDVAVQYARPEVAAAAPFEWCTVCVNPAFYACTTPREGQQDKAGCGLRLCEDCFMQLESVYSGDLVTMVEVRAMDPDEWETMRADAELFTNNQFPERFGLTQY